MILAKKDSPYFISEYYPAEESKKIASKNRKKLKKGRLILTVIALTLASLFLLFRAAAITEATYKIEKMKTELSQIKNDNEKLKIKIADLKSMSRIEQIAKNELKMQEPSSSQVIYIGGSK
ncbi:cell division protein FtsL [Thermovenabulum gondwanense]|uniref:Cell division protein FtsL n=1 Tax=Thermovenabulum gondwanense TaxID=520767 RepID=A0A162MLY5_9FIRM|nr:cell division protein FtsL [Thermovenabulum gondwanense]KYO66674.1 hypothetical protein ATZ99_09180 [Thermovenabulum gondwanense]